MFTILVQARLISRNIAMQETFCTYVSRISSFWYLDSSWCRTDFTFSEKHCPGHSSSEISLNQPFRMISIAMQAIEWTAEYCLWLKVNLNLKTGWAYWLFGNATLYEQESDSLYACLPKTLMIIIMVCYTIHNHKSQLFCMKTGNLCIVTSLLLFLFNCNFIGNWNILSKNECRVSSFRLWCIQKPG